MELNCVSLVQNPALPFTSFMTLSELSNFCELNLLSCEMKTNTAPSSQRRLIELPSQILRRVLDLCCLLYTYLIIIVTAIIAICITSNSPVLLQLCYCSTLFVSSVSPGRLQGYLQTLIVCVFLKFLAPSMLHLFNSNS